MEKGKQQEKSKKPELKKTEINKEIYRFSKFNNKLLLIGLGFLVAGFLLMIGGGTDDPKVFSPAIFDFQRLTLAPILLTIGYMVEIYAIMYVPKDKKSINN